MNPVNGNLLFSGIIYNNNNYIDIYGDNGKTITFSGGIEGGGGVAVKQNSTVILVNNNSYSGGTVVEAGTLELQGSIENSDVTVKSGATLKINGDAVTVASLTVESGGNVEIVAGKSLTVSGDLSNSGTFTIKSDATGTGSFIVNGAATGNITAERYIPGVSEEWHLVSAPVTGQEISGVNNWQPNGSYLDGSGYDFYTWSEANKLWVNRKNLSGGSEEEPYFDIINDGLDFVPPHGYMTAFEIPNEDPNPIKTFTGDPVTTTQTFTMSKTGTSQYTGLNLVGNPFTSTIAGNSNADATNNFINANTGVLDESFVAYYYWDNSIDDYQAINQESAAHFIEVGQGFFVIAKDNAGSLSFNTNLRKHGDATFYKTKSERSALVISLTNHDGKSNLTELVLNDNATYGLDPGRDAAKLMGNTEVALYSYINDSSNENLFAIQTIPSPQEEFRIPLGLLAAQSGVFHFSFEPTELFTQEGKVYLFDKVTQMKTEITAEAEYLFELEEAGEYNDRFEIHFGVVGLGEQEQATTLNAYAYNNRLFVNNSLEQAQIAVYDLQGRLLMQQSASTSGLQSLPLDLPAGVYVVRLSNAQEAKSVKINVQ